VAKANALQSIVGRLLGISTYQAEPAITVPEGTDLDDSLVVRLRKLLGGQIQLPSYSQTKWYLDDLDTAEHNADSGDLRLAGRLMAAARRDGVISGVLSTRTGGLVRLPRRFRGDPEIVKSLELGNDSVRSVFDEMCPPSELALLAADGLLMGVGVGELLPVPGRDYPVLCRYDPQYLQYVWSENQWYYLSAVGRLKITPGDGRWVLHTPGGRIAPWQSSLWRAIGRAYIRKDHANWHKDLWEAKLANPARVAVAPQGASEQQKDSWFQAVMAWGVNTVFGMTPGYDVKLVESNGRGYDCFVKTIADQNTECIISIAGQTVTVDGGAGFQNSDIHKTIRADLIKETADSLAYTINTQILPIFIARRYGVEAIDSRPCVMEYDVTPPKDRNAEATSMVTVGNAISGLTTALASAGLELDVVRLCEHFAIPLVEADAYVDTSGANTGTGTKPSLRLVKGGADSGDGVAANATDAAIAGGKPVADTALNGAQVTGMLDVVERAAAGRIPRETAIETLKVAFLLTEPQADALLGTIGRGFVPASAEPPDRAAAPPAPEAPDAPDEVAA